MMTHTYKVTGMTCMGCREKVQKTLAAIPYVKSAKVMLNPPEAIIEMDKHIATQDLNNVLKNAGAYSIEEVHKPVSASDLNAEVETKPTLKTYYPLILVFIYIIGGVLLRSFYIGEFHWMDMMNNFMGGFFIAFSFFKILNLEGFAMSYLSYDIIAKRWMGYGYVYPFIELALGVSYLMHFNPLITNAVTFVVMGISSIGVIQSLLKKNKIRCACLGAVFNLPMSTITLLEDLLMVVMALIMLIFYN